MGKTQNFVNVSPEGVKFICDFEGFVPIAYKDTGGVLTIGYGMVVTPALRKTYKSPITEEQGRQMMATYLASECKQLSQLPFVGFLQHQQDAIVSLCYNIGLGAFTKSTIYQRLIYRSVDLSPWLLFVKDKKGEVEQGLVERRKKELKLFIYGSYS
jgi:lysozyme